MNRRSFFSSALASLAALFGVKRASGLQPGFVLPSCETVRLPPPTCRKMVAFVDPRHRQYKTAVAYITEVSGENAIPVTYRIITVEMQAPPGVRLPDMATPDGETLVRTQVLEPWASADGFETWRAHYTYRLAKPRS